MNIDDLKIATLQLREQLELCKDKSEIAAILYSQLEPLLSAVEQGKITQNIEPREIPGHRLFEETNLRENSNLKKAYANFYVEIIGGREWSSYKLLKEKMDKT